LDLLFRGVKTVLLDIKVITINLLRIGAGPMADTSGPVPAGKSPETSGIVGVED